MHILYHHRTQGTGAEGVHIAQIIKGLRGLGYQVSVASPTDEDPLRTAGDNPFAKKKGGLKKRLLSLVSRYLPQILFECLEMAYNRSAYSKIKGVFENKSVDLIYERYAFFMTAGARVVKEKKIPFIVEVNEIAGHDRVRKQVCINKAKKTEQIIFRQADAIIVVSPFLKNEIMGLGISGDKIFVMPNGVDEELFDPQKYDCLQQRARYSFKEDDVVIGFIGWFVPWHNLQFLMETFTQVDRKNCKLVLVGDGVLKDNLVTQVRGLGIADKVIFTGAVPYAEVPAMINMMDICIIPDSNKYRSPIKMFEYMAMGKTVIAPDYEPIRSIIKDGEDGIIFSPGDKGDLLKRLNMIVDDQQKRQVLGSKARERILSQHLWKHNAQKVIEIYRKVARQ